MDIFHFYSTLLPKYKQYQSDGQGRDTYICIDFGGSIKTVPKPDIFERKSTSSPRKYSPNTGKKAPMPIFYHSDGSGRDYYITCNNGGLTKTVEYGGKKDIFKESLRKNIERLPTDAFSHRMNKWTDPRYRSLSNTKTGEQASQRLYNKTNAI